ncbi:ISNCY family transposase [Haloterrigena sp. H1]|uniref:transposase n=1 Tax=Haloterrigena sp. H1 TaxID=2552943 RepID=UPI00110E2DFF|nr:transposase [Haloterrigena sp. H1]TMT81379.1 ISNCY family transposase [Haloterrigena sp. H1]TMT81549.1 ISNCY family transposase [Haloterrigena sp. H1]TMT87450.1 ISNCY family transposase [Haloterrigena sp. H1]
MASNITPAVDDDAPALAGAIVIHAKKVCETADHLWRVLGDVSIPVDGLTDTRQQHKVSFGTESMARVYIYQTIYDLAQSEVADRLENRPALLKQLGLNRVPTQQNLSYAWNQFSEQTKTTLEAAAKGIAREARDHDVISEALIPINLDEKETNDDKSDSTVSRAHVREHGSKVVELARRHGFAEFDSDRADNRVYEDEQILDLFSNACLTQGSAHSEGEAGWFLEENEICDDSTFLRVIKQFATPSDEEVTRSVQELQIEDIVAFTELYREAVMASFNAATENILKTIRHEDPFDDRHVVAAVDFTHVPYHVWPWIDKDEKIPKAEYPPMVSGYKEDGEIKHGYTFATITIVGNDVPIILGIEPVKERSAWEPEDAPADSKADVVDVLLDTAQQYVDLDEVLLDRGFYSNEVYATIHDRGLVYMTPVPKYEDDYEAIGKIKSKEGVDAAVKNDVPFAIDGELHHTAEFLYAPATDEEAEGSYAVFVTNRDHVAPEEIIHVTNSYSRRWDIENQYKSVKAFLPKTSSKDYRVRLFSFTFAALLYNLWKLTDYLVKLGTDREIRSPPVVTARTFVRAVSQSLRQGG